MLKLSLLVFNDEYRSFLEELRKKGVVHINVNQDKAAADEVLQEKMALAKRIDTVARTMDSVMAEVADQEKIPFNGTLSGEELLADTESKLARRGQIEAERAVLKKDMQMYQPWGNELPYDRLEMLEKNGWKIYFYSLPDKYYDAVWEDEFNAVVISNDRGNTYFITVTSPDTERKLPYEPYQFPSRTYAELVHDIKELDREYEAVSGYIADHSSEIKQGLAHYQQEIYGIADMCNVHDATEALLDGKVAFVEGWVPAEKKGTLSETLKSYSVCYEFSEPEEGDDVPVLLRNSRFARLFEPITRMFALPQYEELDPTPFFAPFFMLFFGLCLGDGGYGLLIFLVCWLLLRKADASMKGILKLGMVLGVATVFVGLMTGSFFGITLAEVEWNWLKGVKEYFLTSGNYADKLGGYDPMMVFSVIIGLVQIFFGMIVSAMKAVKQKGILYALSTLGWVAGLLSAAAVFGLPLLGVILPVWLVYVLYALIGISAFAIVFLNSPGKNPLVNIGSAIWGVYNMATGLLGDTLSYIRLFALGLTGSILGGVFNTLAFELTTGMPGYVRWIAVLAILLAGHAINFGLCMIGAFVHPLRLTFVEFYKNANFEGGGEEYSPLRKRIAE